MKGKMRSTVLTLQAAKMKQRNSSVLPSLTARRASMQELAGARRQGCTSLGRGLAAQGARLLGRHPGAAAQGSREPGAGSQGHAPRGLCVGSIYVHLLDPGAPPLPI